MTNHAIPSPSNLAASEPMPQSDAKAQGDVSESVKVPTRDERKWDLAFLHEPTPPEEWCRTIDSLCALARKYIAALAHVEGERDQLLAAHVVSNVARVERERDALRAQLAEAQQWIDSDPDWKAEYHRIATEREKKISNLEQQLAEAGEAHAHQLAATANAKRLREAEGLLKEARYCLWASMTNVSAPDNPDRKHKIWEKISALLTPRESSRDEAPGTGEERAGGR